MTKVKDWHALADPEMIDWCAKLNAVPGIETRQSCSGHKPGDVGKAEGLYRHETNGNVWFICDWISHDVAVQLANIPTMDRVRLLFFPNNEAIWDLSFAGNNKGKLKESLESILDVLQG